MEIIFNLIFIYIRVYDVFLNKRGLGVVKVIGNIIGIFIEFDDLFFLVREKFMRIWVGINIIKLLVRCMSIITGSEESKGIEVKYERLFNFYYVCGKIGYVDRDCLEYDTGGRDEFGERVKSSGYVDGERKGMFNVNRSKFGG